MNRRRHALGLTLALAATSPCFGQPVDSGAPMILLPDRVFDGETMHAGWAVVVEGERIAAAGPAADVVAHGDARTIQLAGATLLPGLIDAHTHLFLHP